MKHLVNKLSAANFSLAKTFALKRSAALMLLSATTLPTLAFAAAPATAPATAATAAAASDGTLPPALRDVLGRGGIQLIKTFPAAGGLTGYIISQGPGKNTVVYSTATHDVLLTGRLIDASGNDLSAKYVETYGPKLDLDQFGSAVEGATSIVEGATGKAVKSTLYVFMDPNCIFCHLTWRALQPYEAAGLQVHWITMGFLKPDSAGKAAALLQAKNPAAALKEAELHYSEKDESAGITPLATIPANIQATLNTNLGLFQKMGFQGTPTILYKDANGKWANVEGMPKLSMLPQMLRMPEQPETDPELQRFR